MSQTLTTEQLGRCCYGGFKPKSACASCAAWPVNGERMSERLASLEARLGTIRNIAEGELTAKAQQEIARLAREALGASSSPVETSAPYLHDRANGVQGVYCIARVRNGTTECWTGQAWAAFCNDLYFDLRNCSPSPEAAPE